VTRLGESSYVYRTRIAISPSCRARCAHRLNFLRNLTLRVELVNQSSPESTRNRRSFNSRATEVFGRSRLGESSYVQHLAVLESASQVTGVFWINALIALNCSSLECSHHSNSADSVVVNVAPALSIRRNAISWSIACRAPTASTAT
jgi:hypothetical protein